MTASSSPAGRAWPAPVDPFVLARRGALQNGDTPIVLFERLADALADDVGSIVWSAQWFVRENPGESRQSWVDLQADATLALPCSRCAEAVSLPVAATRRLRVVLDEMVAATLDEAAEDHDVIAADNLFDVLELIEDELIMALPAFPEHVLCPVLVEAGTGLTDSTRDVSGTDASAADPTVDSGDRQYPFADLASRLGKK